MTEGKVALVRVLNLERDTGYFDASSFSFAPGQKCVVDHAGLRLGIVESVLATGEEIGKQLERIVRPATDKDIDAYAHNRANAQRILSSTKEIVASHGLPMHLIAAEYTLDSTQLRIYFTAPHRVDFRALLRELAARFGVRIELRQMGVRDEVRIKGGVARCGRLVCCHTFIREPKPIPMELAYDQELFVSPERITGVCGRLMCCLSYEHEAYKCELKSLPRLGMWVSHKDKRGKVIAHNIFRQTVTILTDAQERIEVDAASVTILPAGKKGER